jgi:cytochrome c biogenesis protein CcmG/thiol:disulfide interchange protein DsbE
VKKRPALVTAVVMAVVLALLVAVLATREPAVNRVAKSPLLGKQAPVLAAPTIDGGEFELADLEGQWVLVNFLASWCEPCKAEHDDLVQFSEAHAATRDASVVSVVFDDDADNVRRYFAERGGDWPVVLDDDGAAAVAWGVPRAPETFLVAPNGQVVLKIAGELTYAFVEEQLQLLRSGS